jgi:type III protein arginine methyltransferase
MTSLPGLALSSEGEAAVQAFAAGLAGPDRARRITGLAGVLVARGLQADAALLCRQAVTLVDDAEVAARARMVISAGVPTWHVGLLRDRVRAEAYDRALRRVVEPGQVVLDVGTGSGLLAMMAARAGAQLVVACERDPTLAQVATDVIERNGLGDRIRVVAKDSRDLVVGVDLPRPADVVVSEIVSNDLLGERVLETLRSVRRRLLTEDAVAIPRRGSIHVALAMLVAGERRPITDLAGFDLSAFRAATAPYSVVGDWSAVSRLSEPVGVFSFDLGGDGGLEEGRCIRYVTVTEAGRLDGIVQWMSLDLSDDERLTSGPGPPRAEAWAPLLHHLDRPVHVTAGQRVAVHAWHSGHDLLLWAGAD